MEQSPLSSRRRDELEFNLREWSIKARISRENASSRRFSASNIRREDTRSFRSNMTISSTASSPGYTLRDEIDPSTYSFTTALKALQAKSACSWECLSPDGFALNSKWNEAEKYICNPLSGEVPMECLSAKTLSGRSSRTLTSKITMSAPLVYSNLSRPIQTRPYLATEEDETHFPFQEKKMESMTRDVGTQSTPPDISSSTPSPASTPPIEDRSLNRHQTKGRVSLHSNAKLNSDEQVEAAGVKDTREGEETKRSKEERKKKSRCRQLGGCMSWRSLWMRKRLREKHKLTTSFFTVFHVND